jgi:hypothetical protein
MMGLAVADMKADHIPKLEFVRETKKVHNGDAPMSPDSTTILVMLLLELGCSDATSLAKFSPVVLCKSSLLLCHYFCFIHTTAPAATHRHSPMKSRHIGYEACRQQ